MTHDYEDLIVKLLKACEKSLYALRWCGVSADFAPGGKRRVGWEKLGQPAIEANKRAIAAVDEVEE